MALFSSWSDSMPRLEVGGQFQAVQVVEIYSQASFLSRPDE